MTAAELLASLNSRGVLIVPGRDGSLHYRPRDALSTVERADLAHHRDAIVALLDENPVGWRSAVMRAQIMHGRAIPMLLARPATRFGRELCCSCGDRLGEHDRYRCPPCVEAAVQALVASRADVKRGPE